MVIRCSNGIELDRKRGTVTHMGEFYTRHKASCLSLKLFSFVLLSNGVSPKQAFCHVYGADPAGGPLIWPHIFHIMLNQMEKRFFDRLQIEWRSWRIAGVNFYSIVPRHQLLDPRRFSFTSKRRLYGRPINSRGATTNA
jgi:hypothetical protein